MKPVEKRILVKRAELLRALREWFYREGFLEVDTPLAYRYAALDPHIDSMTTAVAADGRCYELFLQTSPEYCMKQLLANGSGNIFQICKAFRDGEISHVHNPEFMMLEFYRVNADYYTLMDDVERLIRFVARNVTGDLTIEWGGRRVDLEQRWRRVTMRELFARHVGVDILSDDVLDQLRSFTREKAYPCSGRETFEELFHHVFVQEIDPRLADYGALFVTEYPSQLAALARRSPQNPSVVERCELYIAGMELGNGFTELTDAGEQETRFRKDQQTRRTMGKPVHEMDRHFLAALRRGLPPCTGIAIGVDRLLMLLTGASDINEVIFGGIREQFLEEL